ncbi:MAG: hypothetical protein O7B99_12205 [Planctomycetota bacterium]|nr:hypothetical protein [Planctomycetota bacterium]
MEQSKLAIGLPLAFLAVGAPLGKAVEELTWAPAEGTTLIRVFESERESSLAEMHMVIDGEERDPPELPDFRSTYSERITVTDELVSVGDGRPLELRRTFDELFREAAIEAEESLSFELVSDLVDETVVFRWDEDEEEYVIEPEDESLDEALFEWLEEDMDLRLFLPEGEVDEGDSWDVDIEAYKRMINPGGFLGFYSEEVGERDEQQEEFARSVLDALEGDITATLDGTRDEDGVNVAVIALAIEVSAEVDREVEADEGPERTEAFAFERELEGELLWNLDAGVFHSLELEGDGTETTSTIMTFSAGDRDIEFEQSRTMEGTITFSARIEIEDEEEE